MSCDLSTSVLNFLASKGFKLSFSLSCVLKLANDQEKLCEFKLMLYLGHLVISVSLAARIEDRSRVGARIKTK